MHQLKPANRYSLIAVRLSGKKKVLNLSEMWYRNLAETLTTQGDFGHESPTTLFSQLGLKSVTRSTVADANNTRPVDFFKDLFAQMYALCQPHAPRHKFRFKCKLYSMDATTISLCLSIFPWASFRKNKAGVKVNTVLDHDGYIPALADISNAKIHESRIAKSLSLPKGSLVTFDKGYICYSWFRMLGDKGISFVTRLKDNAQNKLVDRRPVKRKPGLHLITLSM